MTTHLSDEAVAAFADGVLHGTARARAASHTRECVECAHAVAVQREAVWALRSAPAPALPTGLLDRLRSVPEQTPVTMPLTGLAADGSPVFPAFGTAFGQPVAAFVAQQPARGGIGRRLWPFGGRDDESGRTGDSGVTGR